MGFFKDLKRFVQGGTEEERAANEEMKLKVAAVRQAELVRQQGDIHELERGGIPSMARQRLLELAGEAKDTGAFTSNLAPDELALLRRAGYRARGMVAGSALYHVGNLYASAWQDVEVAELSHAYDQATGLAVGRMQQELNLLGAHGVVGVRINLYRREWAERTIEVQMMGTAVEGPGPVAAQPWLSDLSVQEWFALNRAGYDPAGLVYGHCAWFILTTQQDDWDETSFRNVEMGHWSQALSKARHIALAKVQFQCQQVRATGVVGVNIQRRLDHVRLSGGTAASERLHHSLLMSVIGTAIQVRPDAPQTIPQTVNVLSLKEGRLKPWILRQQADLSVRGPYDEDDDGLSNNPQ